jgi:hypothetical protein
LPNPEAKWWIALSQFHDGGARKPEGTLFIDFLQQLPACLFRHAGSGLSTPALKRRQFLVTPRGQFSKAREENEFLRTRLCRVRRMVLLSQLAIR